MTVRVLSTYDYKSYPLTGKDPDQRKTRVKRYPGDPD